MTKQPVETFIRSSAHYLKIFKHYLTLTTYNPAPVLRYLTKVTEGLELNVEQIVSITEMIGYVKFGSSF